MSQKKWWEIYPRLEYEFRKLDEAGIKHSIDKDVLAIGVVRLELPETVAGKVIVIFPDLYPYFRFEIYAPELNLKYHQHPLEKNLCMIGRATDNWDQNYTVADFIKEQLPKVLRAGESSSNEEVDDIEEHQAEPISDYYSSQCLIGSSVIINGSWQIDNKYESGTLILGTKEADMPLSGWAVLEVQDEERNTLVSASNHVKEMYSGGKLIARWVRLYERPIFQTSDTFFKYLQDKDPFPQKIERYKVKGKESFEGGMLTIRAVLFPEETHKRRQTDQGWLFICNMKVRKSYGPKT